MKRFIFVILTLAIAVCSIVPTTVPAIATPETKTFSVTVPTSLPIWIDSNGKISTSADAQIVNHSEKAIEIKEVFLSPKNDWSITSFDKDFSKEKVGLREFGFQIQGSNTTLDGLCSVENFTEISAKDTLTIKYFANVAVQKDALIGDNVADVTFTIGWAENEPAPPEPEIPEEPEIPDTPNNPSVDAGWFTFDESTGTITGYSKNPQAPSNVVVPNMINGVPVVSLGPSSFDGCTHITTVTIPDGVVSISDNTFNNCLKLKEVSIPNSITSIGDYAFNNCLKLRHISIPNSVMRIGGRAFSNCLDLASIDIDKPTDSIQDAPWSASNATVNWMG